MRQFIVVLMLLLLTGGAVGQEPGAAQKKRPATRDASKDPATEDRNAVPEEEATGDDEATADDDATADGEPQEAPESLLERASYTIGLQIGRNLKRDGADLDVRFVIRGLMDAFSGKRPALTPEESHNAMQEFTQEMDKKMAERLKVAGDKNRKEGDAFLAANKKKEGVVTLKSGLQYKVLKTGDGPSPKKTDVVRTHYHGTLIDGTVFDSSVERDEPATFPVGKVIAGWTEALLKMKVGDKWQLFIPSELAYKTQGNGPIEPNAVLVFEIELLGIE